MRPVVYGLAVFAVALAWAAARGHPAHRAVAAFLSLGLACDGALLALHEWVLPPPDLSAPPLTGWLRVAGDLDTALFLVWPAALAALARYTLAKRSPLPVLLGYVAVNVVLVLAYPAIRTDLLRRVLLAAELVALLVGMAAVISWRLRHERANVTTLCTGVLVVGHFATVVAGPYRFGLFGEVFVIAQWAQVLIYAVLILLQAGSLWEARKS